MLRKTSILPASLALICITAFLWYEPAMAQDTETRTRPPARETPQQTEEQEQEPATRIRATVTGQPGEGEEELSEQELEQIRELQRLREIERLGEIERLHEMKRLRELPEPVEPELPLTAAERFAELERFGMRVFGYVPEPAPEQQREDEQPQQTALPTRRVDEVGDGTDTRPRQLGDEKSTRSDAERPVRRPATPGVVPGPRPVRETRVGGVLASEAVPPTYVVGPGDQLAVRVWTDAINHIEAQPIVDADGNIYLELLGQVTVAGERISRLREMIGQRYRTFFDRAEVDVGLSRTRIIEVRVTGDVTWPGTHVLSGAATLFSALDAAGGPGQVGSFRAVKLMRRGEEPEVFDLYNYLLEGDPEADVPLEPNDTIFVPPLPAEFGVTGEVRRPARYEIKEAVTLAQALQMAAGVTATGFTHNAELWRVGESGVRELLNVNPRTEDAEMCMLNGDLLVIPPVLEDTENTVALEGAVRRPGTFQVREDMTVSDLLRIAQGPSEAAHMEEAAIWRLGEDLDYDLMPFDLSAALAGDPQHDLALMPRDRVIVYLQEDVEAPMEVSVAGAVREPDTIAWTRGMRVSDLVKQAGGFAEGAYASRGNLLRLGLDQRRELIPVNLQAALSGDVAADLLLERGDMLTVLMRDEVTEISEIRVTGLVKEQGWYDRPQGMRVSDAIVAAGGLAAEASGEVQYTPGGVTDSVNPIYLKLRRSDQTFEVEPDPVIGDNDLIAVLGTGNLIATPPAVTIRGRVNRPGSYALQSTSGDPDTVYALIQRAGGLLSNANPNGIVLYRLREEIIAAEQEEDLKQTINHFNRELASATIEGEKQRTAGTAAQVSQGLQAALSQGASTVVIPPRHLSSTQWARAVPVNGEALIASEGGHEDLPLVEGDVIVVPDTPTTVTVMGAVVRPGAVPYEDGLKPADYIAKAGNFTADARKNRSIVIRANGEVTPNALRAEIRPGDIILVPSDYIFRNVNKLGTLERVLNAVTAVIGGYLIFK